MIEKKKMFMTWTLELNTAVDVIALVDVDEKEVLAYQSDVGEKYRIPRSCERFFDTEQEANDYIKERIIALKEDRKKVKDVLDEIYSYMDDYDENEESPIKLGDFLPGRVRSHYCNKGAIKYKKMVKTLLNCIHTKCIEVAGCSIALDNIGHIEWDVNFRHGATIFSISGERIIVEDFDEKELLKQIFRYGKTAKD